MSAELAHFCLSWKDLYIYLYPQAFSMNLKFLVPICPKLTDILSDAFQFKEAIFKSNEVSEVNIQKSTLFKAGDISYMIDFMGCHQLKNLSNHRALSLHLYAKPIRNCNIYDEQSKEFVPKKMSYHTVYNSTIS